VPYFRLRKYLESGILEAPPIAITTRGVNLKCNRPLFGGRTCCHVKGHGGRHSHTWQPGDARDLVIDDKLIDMETGEVAGYGEGLGQQVIEDIVSERITNPPTRREIQAKARRVLEMQYGFKIPDKSQRVYASAPKGYDWHYEGDTKAIGIDAGGHDVEAWSIASDACTLATVENSGGHAVLRVGRMDDERPVVTGLPSGVVSDLVWSPDGTSLAFNVAAPTEPPSLWLWRDDVARAIWQPEPHPAGFVDFEPVAWESFDGTRIPGWFALPRGPQPAGGYPAIMWVHGGPVGQARPNFRPDIQMLLAQGFAVLLPNVRGSSGYGRSYTESDDVERRLDSVTDLAHGRHWLAEHPAIDGERIGIMGQSYGGFMVMSAITEHPELWRAAVNYYGIADFVTLLAGTGAWRRNHRASEYGDPEHDAQLFARISPIHRVDRIRAPVLIAHGTRDPRVPIGESEQFVRALQERQKKVAYETFEYAGHGFIRPDDRRRIYRAVAEFFAANL